MPTPEQIERIKQLATSPQELAYFFDALTSPDWLPLVRDGGLLGKPPLPIEQGGGVMFPFWPASRYMVRIAAQAPQAVADVLWAARDSPNPRVWWDTVDALIKMPPEQATRFIPHIKRWVHHPWRLGLDRSVADLARHLIAVGARDQALDLARSLARLVAPEGWPASEPWVVLDNHDYGEEIPTIGRALAALGPDGPVALVEELEAFLAVERPPNDDDRHADLSVIWRPAIEDHAQNEDFDREARLVVAARDGFEEVLNRSPKDLGGIVTTLLASAWPVVRRIGLHLLVAWGDRAPALVAQALTNRDLLADEHYRHELYRLVTARFGELTPDAKLRFITNVRSIAEATVTSATKHQSPAESEIVRKVIIRRWFGAVSDHLSEADRAELEVAQAGTGPDPNPDFPVFHMSWWGSTSPLSSAELLDQDPDQVADYLAAWEEPAGFGPYASAEGLADQIADAVAKEPARFAPTVPRYLGLKPAYFNGLINGLQKAIQTAKPFDWAPVLAACEVAIGKADEGPGDKRGTTWEGLRISIARLLERGLAGQPAGIDFATRESVWSLVARLVEDPDPTPAAEARFGPPNMDPETYSLNTTRGVAFHALFRYVFWCYAQAGRPALWSISDDVPEASAVLDAHLAPERDSSVAVRAAYGWWLPVLVDRDSAWVRDRAARIVGRAETDLERAAFESFLFRGRGSLAGHQVFAEAYAGYAEHLAALDTKPSKSGRAGDPVESLIDHLVKPWLWYPETRDVLPLRTLLVSGKPWLAAEVVAEAGRLIFRTEAKDISSQLDAAYRDLWAFALEAIDNLEGDGLKEALAPFAWWFASALPGAWTLPELLRLLDRGISPDPDFVVFRRLPYVAADHPEETLRVIEQLAAVGDERWTLRAHEGEIRQVLETSITSHDENIRARAEAAVHRLGRLGLGGLASLLHDPRRESR